MTEWNAVLKEGREAGRVASGNDAHGRWVQMWAALYPCAEPTCEAVENPSPVSSGVLVTVKSMIYWIL